MNEHRARRPPEGRPSTLRGLLALAARSPLFRRRPEQVWTDWYHKPKALALLQLARMRHRLNRLNLFDPYAPHEREGREIPPKPDSAEFARTIDGTYNDLEDPLMGAAGLRFGRNTSWRTARPDPEDLLSANPREISRRLMTRDEFKPAPFINLLAAAWIQFMTHDWFSHGPPLWDNDLIELPLTEDDPLRKKYRTATMFVPATLPDPSRAEDATRLPPVHLNENTHWWDASQLYGSDEATAASLRAFEDGKLLLDDQGRLPTDILGIEKTGFRRNWWVGLSLLHELFAREHNRICDMLKAAHPTFTGRRLYDTARMINAALMAKIHTLEWTYAILPNPVLKSAMRANWYGLLGGRGSGARLKKSLPRSFTSRYPALFGILGGSRDLHRVPYAITEEFVSVYRMHPLLPESLWIGDEDLPLQQTRNRSARKLLEAVGADALWHAFGTAHPGQLVLRNYPAFLQDLRLPGLPVFDLAAVDILRDRERGVPRYNGFRRALGLEPIRSFGDLTDDPKDVADLEDLYHGDIETLDLLIGCLAESRRPSGFAFGETIFQVFILNASRRLQADRFFTTHYTPDVYTPEGLRHVEVTTMKSLLLRHYPALRNTGLPKTETAFHPWRQRPISTNANHRDK